MSTPAGKKSCCGAIAAISIFSGLNAGVGVFKDVSKFIVGWIPFSKLIIGGAFGAHIVLGLFINIVILIIISQSLTGWQILSLFMVPYAGIGYLFVPTITSSPVVASVETCADYCR